MTWQLMWKLMLTAVTSLGLACCARTAATTPLQAKGDAATASNGVPHRVFPDADPHPAVAQAASRYPVHGIDVSRWQGDIDWPQTRKAGIAFAYIKATEGGDILDPGFRGHRDGARRAGLRHGAYHFFYFCRPAAEQARWFIRHVPKDRMALPPVLDMEWTPHSPTCTKRPGGAEIRAEAKVFLDMLEAHYGRRPLIYTTPDFYHQSGIAQLADARFWLRSVAARPEEIYPGASWVLWQYTGTGLVPGVGSPVDINVFSGSTGAWQRWER